MPVYRLVCVTFGLPLLLCFLFLTPSQAQTYSDETFPDFRWSLHVIQFGNGGHATAAQEPAGGNPGAYRRYTNVVDQPSENEHAIIHVYHINEDALWIPGEDGEIGAIAFREDRMTVGDDEIGGSIGLRQGDTYYYAEPAYVIDGGPWRNYESAGLDATAFISSLDESRHPDFSETGEPIHFGFMRANSRDPGLSGSTSTGGTDNWSVSVASTAGASGSLAEPFRLCASPNPMTGATTIRFRGVATGCLAVEIYDARGRRVRTLLPDGPLAGHGVVRWGRDDDSGRPVRPGVYFCRLTAPDASTALRVVVLD